MKDVKNYIIAVLAGLLAFSVFVNIKAISTSKNPTPYHEEATIAFQTCMQMFMNQPASLVNGSTGWASANTSRGIAECAEFANAMDKDK